MNTTLVPSPNLEYKWYLNGGPVNGADDDSASPSLVIPSLQSTNLGLYQLKFELNDDNFFSAPIEVQVNSEGQQKVLARGKYADAAQSGLSGGVLLGYNGTQIFNTTNAIVDTNAPTICGVPPGAAYWFAYKAPTNGIMTINTSNSAFATLLGAFTYYGALTSYTNLVLLACDNNSGGDGTNTASSVQFTITNGSNYFIVVGGVNGAAGVANLNYSLSPGFSLTRPLLTSQPQALIVSAQTAVSLSVVASGTSPLSYQWWKNSSAIRQQTNASLLLRSPQTKDSGLYTVVITNVAGAVTSAPANVNVISTTLLNLDPVANTLVCGYPGIRGLQYSIDHSVNALAGGWVLWTNGFPDYGGVLWVTNSTMDYSALLLRFHTP